jgi:hypothetical protein
MEFSVGISVEPVFSNERDGKDANFKNRQYTYYNIMCIGWEGDIAYRRGLGMVEKRAWLGLGAKYITFKLG